MASSLSVCHNSGIINTGLSGSSLCFFTGGGGLDQTICVLVMLSDQHADWPYPLCAIHVLKKTSCSLLGRYNKVNSYPLFLSSP